MDSAGPSSRWRAIRPWLPPVAQPTSVDAPPQSSSSQLQAASRATRSSHRIEQDDRRARESDSAALQSRLPRRAGAMLLEVLDVTATAVAVSVITPPPSLYRSSTRSSTASTSSTTKKSKPPVISIQLDRRPWPHVAHASSVTPTSDGEESSTREGGKGSETTVIVYGLDPGREYEISLDIVGGEESEQEDHTDQASLEHEEPRVEEEEVDTTPLSTPPRTVSPLPFAIPSATPEGPPPPYTPSQSSPPSSSSTIPSLRLLLKKLRTTSKRTETSLQSTISALKKSVDKGIKEDQRGRTRILTLEEAIRKAADGEREGEGEGKRCEGLIAELVLREGEARRELTLRKEGKSTTIAVPVARVEEPEVQEPNEEEEEHELADGIADLARELAALNKAIDTVDLARAKEVFKGMEGEIGRIEGELNSIDREEAYRHSLTLARQSEDAQSHADYFRPAPKHQPVPIRSASPAAHKWRPEPSTARTFGKFFSRREAAAGASVSPSSELAGGAEEVDGRRITPQQYAKEHQAMWLPSAQASASSSLGLLDAGVRRRSGSLTLGASGTTASPASWGQRWSSTIRTKSSTSTDEFGQELYSIRGS